VIANAGLGGAGDPMMQIDGTCPLPPPSTHYVLKTATDPAGAPTKPNLNNLDVNLKGVLYTTRLSLHYFRRLQQQDGLQIDRCLILKSSLSAYIDWDRSLQYPVSKAGVRCLMKCLRRTTWKEGIRVNVVAPA
jgi:NAD(P)-dependent dehydrogenase (short-subunit alcohol dehydrogenase family)